MPMSELRKLRRKRGLTLRETARRAGLNAAIVCDLETGKKQRTLARYAGKLAQALGEEVYQLVGGGQLQLAFEGIDWHSAHQRDDLQQAAMDFLKEAAHRKERVPDDLRVWQLPGGAFLLAPAGFVDRE